MSGEVESPLVASPLSFKPYASLVVLCCAGEPEVAFRQLVAYLRKSRRIGHSRTGCDLVVDGIKRDGDGGLSDFLGIFDQIELTVHKVVHRPGWLNDSLFEDVRHELTVAFRKEELIAVHLAPSVRDAFQNWLDKSPRPIVRRVASDIFERALLQGELRGLWLRGTQARRKTRADSKNTAGADLRQTLSPVDDQAYALSSARSVLPPNPSRDSLEGAVGTSPKRSLVWSKATGSFREFAQFASELLDLVAETAALDADGEPVFPLFAKPVSDFANVWGAYDLSWASPVELPDGTDEAKLAAAALLDSAFLRIEGRDNSADFKLEIGMEMRIGGLMRGRIINDDEHPRLSLGLAREPTDPTIALPVRDALQYTDLLTVYYASGHTFTQGALYKPNVKARPFGNWKWKDFSGYSIGKEKPGARGWSPYQIHEAIAEPGDTSLFAWVVKYFDTGWLSCDDGAGEIADFIHVDSGDFTLSLIHVKGADNNSDNRGVSAVAYEVVASQAVKNVMFLDQDLLVEQLKVSPLSSPATWSDGVRQPDRSDLIEAIGARDARDACQVIIVQPHVSKAIYERFDESSGPSEDLLRLRRLENILNGCRPAVTGMGMGADLLVFGSLV